MEIIFRTKQLSTKSLVKKSGLLVLLYIKILKKNNTIMMKNNNTMETQIFKQGDFTLEYYRVYDICFLFYKNNPIWTGKFNELDGPRFINYVFEREPDSKKAAKFIIELHKWSTTQGETFEELLDEYKTIK